MAKILFIGGNGNISWHCAKKAIDLGHDVYELHRGITYLTRRDIHPEAKIIRCDIRNELEASQALADYQFDVVCDFICYNTDHANTAVRLFNGKTKQYIFISSEAVYRRNIKNIPFNENSERKDPYNSSDYISGKIFAENIFNKAYNENGFPITIVRPGYTYDTILPVSIGHNCWTAIDRILKGKPLLIAGDGNGIWNFTHSIEFAERFAVLLNNPDTIGDVFDISTDEWLTWNDVSELLLKALGLDSNQLYHIPYERAMDLSEFLPSDMMYDRMWHNIRSNSKIKSLMSSSNKSISFEEGVKISLDWLNENPKHKRIVSKYELILDNIYSEYSL